jgi:protease I
LPWREQADSPDLPAFYAASSLLSSAAGAFAREDVMEKMLGGKKVAILVENGFEQVELTSPRKALDEAGAQTSIVSPQKEEVQGWNHDEKADRFPVDVDLDDADAADFDGLLLPGGVMNPDKLRINPKAIAFIRAFFDAKKPVGAICHGPWPLIEADVVRGRTMTSWPSVRTDLENAGATVVDREVVVDHGLVTSRNPDDLPAFNAKLIEEIAEGEHSGRKAA